VRFRYLTCDVFTEQPFGGNPLAVFPQARELPEHRMQQVAREINYSETVFVLPPERAEHTRKLRIFTPGAEVPFAGHPTVGTAFVLAAIGEVPLAGAETRVVLEERIGPVEVTIAARDGRPTGGRLHAAYLPQPGPLPPRREEIAALLSLEPEALDDEAMPIEAWTSGIPFLVVPLVDPEALSRATLDLAVWRKVLSEWWAPNIYPVVRLPEGGDADWRVRMFAPGLGVPEDPATGSAATAFAGYLGRREGGAEGTLRWRVEQGIELGRPSLMRVEADKKAGRVTAIRVGGGAVLMAEGEMEVPD